jgi:adenosylcobinamide-phosphate synthase
MNVVAAGLTLDFALGDQSRLHPVAGFGALARAVERALWRPSRAAGALYAASLVAATGAAVAIVERRLDARSRVVFRALVVWTTLGGRSLAAVALALARALDSGDVAEARRIVPALAGRDPDTLDGAGLARAAVESVAENTSDAVVAPLLWFCVLGAPGAAAYRAANTLDSMVGHRSPRYARFGWGAARLDDVLSWPAARLTAATAGLLAPIVGGDPRRAWGAARRDGPKHPSPNAGLVEASFAGALGLQLGGTNVYEGRVDARPLLGDGRPPAGRDVRRAVRLSLAVGLLTGGLAAVLR